MKGPVETGRTPRRCKRRLSAARHEAPKRHPFLLCVVVLLCGLSASILFAAPAQALVPAGGDLYFHSRQPFGWSLDGVTFADADNIWATGCNRDGYWLVHSPDAGMTWQRVDIGLDHDTRIHSLTFVDPSHARALAGWYDETGDTNQIALLTSDDSGVSWNLKPIASPSFLQLGESFVSADVAFIVGREREATKNTWHTRLLATTDGGASWTRTAIGCAYPYDLTAIDARHLWLFDPDAATVWVSSTGGTRWMRRTLPLKGKAGTSFSIDSLQALGVSVAWIEVTRSAEPHHIVMRTADGGRSWRTIARIGKDAAGRLTARSRDEAWLAVSVDDVVPQLPAYYRHTTDGGATWTRSYVCPGSLGVVNVSPDGTLFGVGGGLSRSTDGGATWTRLIGGRFDYWLNDVAAASGSELWAVGWTTPDSPGIYGGYDGDQGLLFRCSDGVTWRRQEIPDGSLLCGVDFADSQVGWAVGWQGRVLRTTDGGTSWVARPTGSNLSIHGVEALDADCAVGIAWDENADLESVIVRTTDGGASWSESSRPASDSLWAMCTMSPGHLLVVGTHYDPRQCLLLESTDSGATWSERLIDCPYTIRDVTSSDSQHAWILASDHSRRMGPAYGTVVLRTTDDGVTWETTDLGKVSVDGFAAIAFADNQNGWLLGDKEMRTTDGGVTWTDTGAAMPISVLGSFCHEPVVRAATSSGGNLWAVGADQLILSTLDTSTDTAPPLSSDDGDRRWHNSAVTTHFFADDSGGTGVAATEYRLDAGTWQPLLGGSVTVDAPSDHSGDGTHRIEYRSTDNSGNVEFPQLCVVRIDTRPPRTRAGSTVRTQRGRLCTLAYRVIDSKPNGGTARVTITFRRRGGATVKNIGLGVRAVNKWLHMNYRCRLAPGSYQYLVKARDGAGNQQSTIGRGLLVVEVAS